MGNSLSDEEPLSSAKITLIKEEASQNAGFNIFKHLYLIFGKKFESAIE